MSAKEYQEVYPHMTDDEKNLMYELWMTGVNRDGHAWVTYGDVERAVGLILRGRIGYDFNPNKGVHSVDCKMGD